MSIRSLFLLLAFQAGLHAATFGTFRTSVGNFEVEFYDEDKPVTVSNFLKYATSGRFDNQFIQRWVPGFVIQAGGYRVVNTTNGPTIDLVEKMGSITNEYSVGRRFSNTFGTIAMARVQGQTNSASSEWFINLSDQNTFLDQQDGGFTVFAKVTAGTNVLNLFVPPIGPGGTNIFGLGTYPLNATTLKDLPVLAKPPTFNDLIYVDFSLRRDLDVRIARTADGTAVSWKSVANLTHIVEYASSPAANSWTELSRQTGTGGVMTAIDPSPGPLRFYRVKLLY